MSDLAPGSDATLASWKKNSLGSVYFVEENVQDLGRLVSLFHLVTWILLILFVSLEEACFFAWFCAVLAGAILGLGLRCVEGGWCFSLRRTWNFGGGCGSTMSQ